jgi:hypothetical protein
MELEYNSARPMLKIPEYGRNVQKLIDHALTLTDREERTKMAHAIVNVMSILNPQLKDLTDYKIKLWDHLFVISNYKLDVDSPYPMPSPDALKLKPSRISYPSNKIRFRHYGKIIEQMIKEVDKLEDAEQKAEQILIIANFMKLSYLNWNRDTVTDEMIFEHLNVLSGGKIQLDESVKLSQPGELSLKSTSRLLGNPKTGFSRQNRPSAGGGWRKNPARKYPN